MNSIKKNFFFSTFLTISNYVFPLITYPYVSRVLQVERIGLCNFVDSIINYFILFSMLGISTYGIREIAKNKSDKTKLNQTFYDLISINILMSILLCFILFISLNYSETLSQNKQLVVYDFADDASDINRSAYKWADIYAKVNINKSFTLFYAYNKIVDYNRIIQLPPYFGIKIWNSYQTIFYCITNYIKSLSNRSVGIHVHIKDYLLQYVHRSRLSYYETPSLKNNGNNYVFFASNLWNIENCNDTTNLIRERFIIACTKNKKIDFEGGFIIPPNHPLKEKYLKYAISKRYNIHEYLDKIKKSKIVFNTPAVHFCHGWKLGEYFCLGKIILSTNFQNNIPNGIQDRKNILFVDPKNIEEIINTITNDISFQNELQQNALSYWKNSACPQKVIEHLISYSNRKL